MSGAVRMAPGGTWSTSLELTEPGSGRVRTVAFTEETGVGHGH